VAALAAGQTNGGAVSLTTRLESQALDLDQLQVVELEPMSVPGDQVVDLRFAYNARRQNPLVAFHEAGHGTGLVFLDGVPFDELEDVNPWSLDFSQELVDQPFDSDDTLIVSTSEGGFFKVGNAVMDVEGGVRVDVARIE
jgi:hypothetical protein